MYIVATLFEAPTKIVLDMYTFHSCAVLGYSVLKPTLN